MPPAIRISAAPIRSPRSRPVNGSVEVEAETGFEVTAAVVEVGVVEVGVPEVGVVEVGAVEAGVLEVGVVDVGGEVELGVVEVGVELGAVPASGICDPWPP